MNLLTDNWLPVRLLHSAVPQWISLSELLTSEKEYEVCLPRDDLEMAALQLVICITQVLFTPKNIEELIGNIRNPMQVQSYLEKIEPVKNWFDLEHPEYPFMQVRGVKAKDITPMDKLMPGLTGATNSCFVNEKGLADQLCGGCTAIVLFNQASNTPSFGGGFKASLRGSAPITTLVQGRHIRETVWLNIISASMMEESVPFFRDKIDQHPTWVEAIKEKANIPNQSIGLFRGLFWQPAHIELCPSTDSDKCSCCGRNATSVFKGFLKAKYNYTVQGLWPHPHSPRIMKLKKADVEEKVAAFTTSAPTWTRLTSFVVQQQLQNDQKEGHQPALSIIQVYRLFSKKPDRLRMAVGGYRSNKASILERRHELLELNKGWHQQPSEIQEMVALGLGYKSALRKSLYVFSTGLKDVKGAGVSLQETGEVLFYRRTDNLMQKALAEARFESPEQLAEDKKQLRSGLKRHCTGIFEEQTRPYLNDPELIKTMAVARRTLYKHLKTLEPETEGGGK